MAKIMALAMAAGAMVCCAEDKVSLFNGRDLAGWTAVVDYNATGGYSASEPTWFVTNGVIRTTGTPFGYLRTRRDDFGDFRLHVEYRWWRRTAKPNSGLFVRLAHEHGSFIPTTVENQLCRGSAGDVLGLAGFCFAGVEPRDAFDAARPLSGISKVLRKGADAERPFGEWNELEVELKGETLVNRLNGVELNRVAGLSVPKGAIAFQSEGGAAEFRNVWIQNLESPTDPTSPTVALVPGVRELKSSESVYTVREPMPCPRFDWADWNTVGKCLAKANCVKTRDASLPPEGYSLKVSTETVEIAYAFDPARRVRLVVDHVNCAPVEM